MQSLPTNVRMLVAIVAASAGDSIVVLRMLTEAEEGFSHACNRFVALRR